MRFALSIKCGNAAFFEDDAEEGDNADARRAEVARILRAIASRLENGKDDGAAFDVNGNSVGTWGFDHAQG